MGGGGAISHCALLSGKWRKVVYNDINRIIVDGFRTAINGGFADEKRWISRKDFKRLCKHDPYVGMCFSFGNELNTYAYSTDIEPLKKGMHYAIIFDDWTLLEKIVHLNFKDEMKDITSVMDRYYFLKKKVAEVDNRNVNLQHLTALARLQNLEYLKRLQQLESLTRLARLQQLESLTRLARLQLYSDDYRDVPVKEKGVIYCDIPYENKKKYSQSGIFDYNAFYAWVEKQELPVYISSYKIDRPNFRCIASIEKRGTLNDKENQLVNERVYRYIKQK